MKNSGIPKIDINSHGGLRIEHLTNSNNMIWMTCWESYHVAKDLWEAIGGNDCVLRWILENLQALKKWRRVNAKEFILKRIIYHDLP